MQKIGNLKDSTLYSVTVLIRISTLFINAEAGCFLLMWSFWFRSHDRKLRLMIQLLA